MDEVFVSQLISAPLESFSNTFTLSLKEIKWLNKMHIIPQSLINTKVRTFRQREDKGRKQVGTTNEFDHKTGSDLFLLILVWH